jgi:hypothetical protein
MCFKTHEALYIVSWDECQYIKGRYTGYPCVLKHMGLTPGYIAGARFITFSVDAAGRAKSYGVTQITEISRTCHIKRCGF